MIAEFIEARRVALASVGIESEFNALSGFGILELQFALPRRLTVFVRPNLHQHQLVTEIGKILERPFAVVFVEKIGNDQKQPTLGVLGDELARAIQKIRLTSRSEGTQEVHRWLKTVPTTRCREGVVQRGRERLNANCIQAN